MDNYAFSTEVDSKEYQLSFDGRRLKSITKKHSFKNTTCFFSGHILQTEVSREKRKFDENITRARSKTGQLIDYTPVSNLRMSSQDMYSNDEFFKPKALLERAYEMIGELGDRNFHGVDLAFSRNRKCFLDTQNIRKILEYDRISFKASFGGLNSFDEIDFWISVSTIKNSIDVHGILKMADFLSSFKETKKIELEPNRQHIFLFAKPDILLNKISIIFRSDFLCDNNLLSTFLKKLIFSKKISFYDCRFDLISGICESFDDEGIGFSDNNFSLVEKGVVKGSVNNLMYANKIKENSTGNSLISKSGISTIGYHSFRIMPGSRSLDEWLIENDTCVLITAISDVVLQPNWDLLIKASSAYSVCGGSIINRLKPFIIKSNLFKLFGESFQESLSEGFNANSINPMIILQLRY